MTLGDLGTQKNPGSIADALDETHYARGWGEGWSLRQKREESVRRLRRKLPEDPHAQEVADLLEECRRNARCKSAACPECGVAAQRLSASILKAYLQAKSGTVVRVSLIPIDGVTRPGCLTVAEHERRVRRWKHALARAGVDWFVGASDWSFNEHIEYRYSPHWAEHIYGFTCTSDVRGLKRRLRDRFPQCDAIPRPVSVKEWDEDTKALHYVMKPGFWRRIGSDDNARREDKNCRQRLCRDTDKQPLRTADHCELLVHLNGIGLQGRLFMRSAQFANLGDVGPVIVDRRPIGRTPDNR